MTNDELALLSDRLERASRRTQPFVLIGLLAIIVSFVIIAAYLQQQRRQAEKLRAIAENGRMVAERRLATAQQLLKALEALQRGDATKHTIPNAIAQAQILTSTGNQATGLAPSIYFFVRDQHQRDAVAGSCSDLLQKHGYNVLGVELVKDGPRNDEVKYFRQAEGSPATALARQAKECGISVPDQNIVWITGDPSSANSPPGYFEIWLAQRSVLPG